MRKYTLEDANPMTYEEFEMLMGVLIRKIKDSNIKFDAVAPVLRNGAIPGTIIANKLEIITMLPVQVKYDYAENRPKQLLPFVLPLKNDLPEKPNILVVESNTYSGNSANLAYDIIKNAIPDATLYYATVTRVFRSPQIELPRYKQYFYGVMTDEAFEASAEDIKNYNLRPKIVIYPWETIELELNDINASF